MAEDLEPNCAAELMVNSKSDIPGINSMVGTGKARQFYFQHYVLWYDLH